MRIFRDNKLICFLIVAVMVTGGALTLISQKVYDTQKTVNEKSRDLVSEQWELRALKAEWAYLTRPDRLEQLSDASARSQIVASKAPSPSPSPSSSTQTEELESSIAPVAYIPTPTLKPLGHVPVQKADLSAPKSENKSNFSSLLNMIGGSQ